MLLSAAQDPPWGGEGSRALCEADGKTLALELAGLVDPAWWGGCVALGKLFVWLSLSFPTCGMGIRMVPGLWSGLKD